MSVVAFTILCFCVAALQSRLPTMWWLGGLRVELLPALVAYSALSFRRGSAIAAAIVAGLAQDALSAAPFGITGLAYGGAALLLSGLREALDRELPWVQISAGAWTAAASATVACVVVGFSQGAMLKIVLLAALSAVIAPMVFFAADYARQLWRTA